jgi:glycine cleavage system H protein
MSEYELDRKAKYAKSHEWVRIENGIAVVGISDAAQDMLSDVVFVELPETGTEVRAGDAVAVVESVKAAEDVYAPISGTIAAVNADLEDVPEEINSDPYVAWLFKIDPTDSLESELSGLMAPDEYDAYVDEEGS